MTERDMFEKSFQRPKNYFNLSEQEKWDIDKSLCILGWKGGNFSAADKKRYDEHYDNIKK